MSVSGGRIGRRQWQRTYLDAHLAQVAQRARDGRHGGGAVATGRWRDWGGSLGSADGGVGGCRIGDGGIGPGRVNCGRDQLIAPDYVIFHVPQLELRRRETGDDSTIFPLHFLPIVTRQLPNHEHPAGT